jgi:hypothetical protein
MAVGEDCSWYLKELTTLIVFGDKLTKGQFMCVDVEKAQKQ